jgi:phage terminase small subunit
MTYPLPAAQFGMTLERFNVPSGPVVIPHADVLRAANDFNDARYHRLTYQQRVFVDTYLSNGFDVGDAALKAFYTTDPDEAVKIGRRIIKKKYMVDALGLAMNYYTERSKVRRDDLIAELKTIAHANQGDFFKNDGDGDPYLEMPNNSDPDFRRKMAAVSEVVVESYTEGRGPAAREVKRIKFKLHDKLAAIKILWAWCDVQDGISSGQQAGTTTVNNNTTVNNGSTTIQQFNIVPVPSGEFVPAPKNPYLIEHEEMPQSVGVPSLPQVSEPSALVP